MVDGLSTSGLSTISMEIQFKKGKDGQNTITCRRADGSAAWSKLYPSFISHDLAHYVVESTLGLKGSFFGLIASGWDISEFETLRQTGKNLPLEAIQTEFIVNLLQVEIAQGQLFDQFNTILKTNCESQGTLPPPPIPPEQLSVIRDLLYRYLQEWRKLPLGEKLILSFSSEEKFC